MSKAKQKIATLMPANSICWLKANKKEGWKRERGIYLGASGSDAHIVLVDKEYRTGRSDDGMREVTTEQIEEKADARRS